MSEPLSEDAVRHVANLAQLDLSDEEVSTFTGQLANILGHANDIESLDIGDVPPSTHALPMTNVFRDDIVVPSLSQEEALSGAPAAEAGQFRVPRILGGEQ